MAILLIADILDGDLNLDQTAKALTAAKELGEVTVLCASFNCEQASKQISELDGVEKVLVADSQIYGKNLAEPLSQLIMSLGKDFTHILAAATALGKNVMPRVAALLFGSPTLSDRSRGKSACPPIHATELIRYYQYSRGCFQSCPHYLHQ